MVRISIVKFATPFTELGFRKETFETFMREDRLELQQQLLEINKNILDTRKDFLELFNRNSQDLQEIKRLLQVDQEVCSASQALVP